MPSFIGILKIVSVGPSSNVISGDVLILTATSSAKIFTGAHSFHIGDIGVSISNNAASSTNTFNPSIVDMPIVI
jgi:spore germination protein PA